MFKKMFSIQFDNITINSLKKNDGIISLVFYIYFSLYLFLFGLIKYNTSIYDNLSNQFDNNSLAKIVFYLPFSLISIIPIFVILKIRRQKLKSIGLRFNKIPQSIFIGIVGAIPFLLININGGKSFNTNILDLIMNFIYFLICISLVEEIVFRGYLQTRILKLIKNKWLSIIFVGLLFGIMHIPFQMLKANMNIIDFLIYDYIHLITTMLMHLYFLYLYTRYNNILAVVLTHALIDFSYSSFI